MGMLEGEGCLGFNGLYGVFGQGLAPTHVRSYICIYIGLMWWRVSLEFFEVLCLVHGVIR